MKMTMGNISTYTVWDKPYMEFTQDFHIPEHLRDSFKIVPLDGWELHSSSAPDDSGRITAVFHYHNPIGKSFTPGALLGEVVKGD